MTRRPTYLTATNSRHLAAASSGRRDDAHASKPNIEFFLRDDRTPGQILTDWMLATGHNPAAPAAFLAEIGLSEQISTQQWQEILEDKAIPGTYLSRYLTIHMPGSALNEDKRGVVGFRVWKGKIQFAQEHPGARTITDLSRDFFFKKRSELLERILKPSQSLSQDKSISEPHGGTPAEAVDDLIDTMSAHLGVAADELAVGLKRLYDSDPSPDKHEFLFHVGHSLPEHPAQEIYQWARQKFDNGYAPDTGKRSNIGRALQMLRESVLATQLDLGEMSKIDHSFISDWEIEKHKGKKKHRMVIPAHHIAELAPALELSSGDYIALLTARLPALNEEWLKKQPANEQAKTLLEAMTEAAGTSHKALSENALGNIEILHHFFADRRQLAPGEVASLVKELRAHNNTSPDKYRWLTPRLETLFADACDQQKKQRQALLEGVVASHTANLLDPETLAKLPPGRQTGQIIHAKRIQKGLGLKKLGEKLDLSESRMSQIETLPNSSLPIDKIDETRKILGFTDEEFQLFLHYRFPAFDEELLNKYPQSEHRRLVVDALEALEHDSSFASITPHKRCGMLLRVKRLENYLTQEEAASLLGLSPTIYCRIENANQAYLSPALLRTMHDTFHFTAKQYGLFFKNRFPALNHSWLVHHPAEKRAGLALTDLMELCELKRTDLAPQLSMSVEALSARRTGEVPITPGEAEKIIQALRSASDSFSRFQRPSEEHLTMFRQQCLENYHPERKIDGDELAELSPKQRCGRILKSCRERMNPRVSLDETGRWFEISGATLSRIENGQGYLAAVSTEKARTMLAMSDDEFTRYYYNRFPALDREYLKTIPPEKQQGKLLHALREREGMESTQELAQKITDFFRNIGIPATISKDQVAHVETGSPLPDTWLPALTDILHLTHDELSLLAETAHSKKESPREVMFSAIESIEIGAASIPDWRAHIASGISAAHSSYSRKF